jgi:hypothetical protein
MGSTMTPRRKHELLHLAANRAVRDLRQNARDVLAHAVNFADAKSNVTNFLIQYADLVAQADRIEQDILSDKQHRHPLVNEFVEAED